MMVPPWHPLQRLSAAQHYCFFTLAYVCFLIVLGDAQQVLMLKPCPAMSYIQRCLVSATGVVWTKHPFETFSQIRRSLLVLVTL